jgi:hypothetical protein
MHEKEKIIITSGIFDPLTKEELTFLKKCKAKGYWLGVYFIIGGIDCNFGYLFHLFVKLSH